MTETPEPSPRGLALRGFIAGFLATLIFHQLTLGILRGAGVAALRPFSMAATWPFGLPAVLSLAFWGGVWGVLFASVDRWFPRGGGYWPAAVLFGGVLPSLVALVVVLPLKGAHLAGGWPPGLLVTAFLTNGAWGGGTGLVLRTLR